MDAVDRGNSCPQYVEGWLHDLNNVVKIMQARLASLPVSRRQIRSHLRRFAREYGYDTLLMYAFSLYHVPFPLWVVDDVVEWALRRVVVDDGVRVCSGWRMWVLGFDGRYILRVTKVSEDALLDFSVECPRRGVITYRFLRNLSSFGGDALLKRRVDKKATVMRYLLTRYRDEANDILLYVFGLPMTFARSVIRVDDGFTWSVRTSASLLKDLIEHGVSD